MTAVLLGLRWIQTTWRIGHISENILKKKFYELQQFVVISVIKQMEDSYMKSKFFAAILCMLLGSLAFAAESQTSPAPQPLPCTEDMAKQVVADFINQALPKEKYQLTDTWMVLTDVDAAYVALLVGKLQFDGMDPALAGKLWHAQFVVPKQTCQVGQAGDTFMDAWTR